MWLVACVVGDLDFSTDGGQAFSQEGRNELIRVQAGLDYYVASLNKTPVSYDSDLDEAYSSNTVCSDSYLDEAYSSDTVCSDLINYHEEYHEDTNMIMELHTPWDNSPWDPGKSAPHYYVKTSAWGQAEFQEGRNVGGSCTPL
jgi:hypothetical protein